MDRRTEEALKTSLTDALDAWLDDEATEDRALPYMPSGLAELMATAALTVLRTCAAVEDNAKADKLWSE